MSNRKLIFASYGFLGYIGQFLLVVSAINHFSDGERLHSCAGKHGEEASRVYDTALSLLIIYHLIEWGRFILMLTTMFIGSNLMWIWYGLSLNTLFGVAAYIACHVYRFRASGKDCEDVQVYRAKFLVVEVIVFWVTFHIMSFPQLVMRLMGKQRLEAAMVEESGSDEEGSDKEKKSD